MIWKYYEILKCHWFLKTEVYGTLAAAILQSMLGLYSNKTCGTMTNYDNGDDDGDDDIYNNGNEDGNGNGNSTSKSGSDGPILNLIMKTRSCGGFSGGDSNGAATLANYIYTCLTIYLRYKEPIKDVP